MMPTQRTKRTARKLDRKQAMQLAERGLTNPEIAKMTGVVSSTVYRFLSQSMPERHALEVFKKERGDVFARLAAKSLDLQERLVDTFDESVVVALKAHEKGSLLHALNIQAGTLYDKERLERGQSTQNLSLLGRLVVTAEAGLGVPKKAEAENKTDPT